MTLQLADFDAVLLDLDGTIYAGNQILPGAVELVAQLAARGQRYACLTNSGSSPRQIVERLAGFGMTIDESHVYPCTSAAADYILETFPPLPRVFNLASSGLTELLDGKVKWVDSIGDACDVVACASCNSAHWSMERQWMALQLLLRGAKLLGLCADRIFPSPRGIEFGAGATTEMLAYAAAVKPIYTGKPEPLFFHELCHRLKVEPHRCVLIGDNLESDIAGARGVGMKAILTLSGVTRDAAAGSQADGVINDLRDLQLR